MIFYGKWDYLYLGNLDAKRDWGYAKDYVKSMWMMLNHNQPDDYVISTGKNFSVRECVEKAFLCVDKQIEWEGDGADEIGRNSTTGDILVKVDPYYFRPTEVEELLGDASKAKEILGWKPTVNFDQLIEMMVKSDLERIDEYKSYSGCKTLNNKT